MQGYISSARAPRSKERSRGSTRNKDMGGKNAKGAKSAKRRTKNRRNKKNNQNKGDECNPDIEAEVIAKCQQARDEMETCCRNIGGSFCDNLQDECDIDVCIAATDDYSTMDDLIYSEFTEDVETECDNQGMFGPVPALLYEFNGDLNETMSERDEQYALQPGGEVQPDVINGALVCDGMDDFVYSMNNLDFTFSAHSMEVLVMIADLESKGGATMSVDGRYMNSGEYSHNKFDSIVYNEVSNNKKWILDSEDFSRTNTLGSDTAETMDGEMVHLVAVYDPESNEAKLYRNGVEEMRYDPGDFLTAGAAGEGWRIMFCQRHSKAETNGFDGLIFYGAFYDYALTDEDVDQLFRSKVVSFKLGDDVMTIEVFGDELLPGQSLLPGQGLLSVDHRYLAALTMNGKFLVYDTVDEKTIFEAEMDDSPSEAVFEEDGRFVIYDFEGEEMWDSGDTHDAPSMLVMGINGELAAYGDDGMYWSSEDDVDASASAQEGLNIFGFKHMGPKWTLSMHSSVEAFLVYFCALLVLVNMICGALYCYNNITRVPYKPVKVDAPTSGEESDTELESDECFLG